MKVILILIFSLFQLCFATVKAGDSFGFSNILNSGDEKSTITQGLDKLYRKLSMKYQPDQDTGNEEKFKEMSLAYEAAKKKLKSLGDKPQYKKWQPEDFGKQATRERAAREQAARDQAAREQAAREQAARDQAARDQAAQEQAREKAAREKILKEQQEAAKRARAKTLVSKYEIDYFEVFNIPRETDINLAPSIIRKHIDNPSHLMARGFERSEIQRLVSQAIEIFTQPSEFGTLMATLKDRGIITFAQFEQSILAHQARIKAL